MEKKDTYDFKLYEYEVIFIVGILLSSLLVYLIKFIY